jgi:four helix bundle protein
VKTQKFQDLIVWQKAHQLVLGVYKETKTFPKEEIYGITSQIRRSAASVAANIVEGYRKKGLRDKIRFLNISEGSIDETKYFLILSKDLELITTDSYEKWYNLADEVSKPLKAYSNAIANNSNSSK